MEDIAKHGNLDEVRCIFEQLTEDQRFKLLTLSVRYKHYDVVHYLLEQGVKEQEKPDNYMQIYYPTREAARNNDLEMLKKLDSYGIRSTYAGYDQSLDLAIEHGNLEMFEYILQKGVSVKSVDLTNAIHHSRYDMIKLIIQKLEKPSYIELCPTLAVACQKSTLDIVKLLLEYFHKYYKPSIFIWCCFIGSAMINPDEKVGQYISEESHINIQEFMVDILQKIDPLIKQHILDIVNEINPDIESLILGDNPDIKQIIQTLDKEFIEQVSNNIDPEANQHILKIICELDPELFI